MPFLPCRLLLLRTVWTSGCRAATAVWATRPIFTTTTQYYRDQGCSEADARAKAATIVNPPGYSEHATGLAADLNTPEHTSLDEGFENTAAFRWL